MITTTQAAPVMLSLRRIGNDPQALQQAFDGFYRWDSIRAVIGTLEGCLEIWALVALGSLAFEKDTPDRHDAFVAPEPEATKKKPSEAKRLFDALQAEAFSQIATLTGGRKDGFDTRLDLEKALSKLPEEQQAVFAAIYLENGELLNRPRTYDEATFLTELTVQEVRTLERKATDALKPVLGPPFFKRRCGHARLLSDRVSPSPK